MTRQWLLPLILVAAGALAQDAPKLIGAADLDQFEHPAADQRLHYGNDALQFGDLRVPDGAGPHPVAIFIHGGCWLSQYGLAYGNKLTAALARDGIATWSIEYRRVGDDGGGWPGTFEDTGAGADYLRNIATEHNLDLDRVVAVGHSAGGQLAMWLAARPAMPEDSPLASPEPLPIQGVVALAPAPDLALLHEQEVCGHVIDKLMGGSPEEVPDRYRDVDPAKFAKLDVPQVVIIGKHDESWAPSGLSYYRAARARGDNVRLTEAPDSGHFEMIAPDSTTGPLVLNSVREMLRGAGR